MNKFNLPRRNVQKERRLRRKERRKQKLDSTAAVSDSDVPCKRSALSLNVATDGHPGYLSGKNRAKLTKRWRRAQKEALQSGLVTMHDIEMMAVDNEEGGTTDEGSVQPSLPKSKKKFSMKKRAKLKLKGTSFAPQFGEPVGSSNVGANGEDAMMQ